MQVLQLGKAWDIMGFFVMKELTYIVLKKHFCRIYVLVMWATFKKFLDIWYTLNTYVSISVSVGHRRYSFESSAASHTKKQG